MHPERGINRDPDLAAQTVKREAFDQSFGLCGLAIEQQVGAVSPDQEVEQGLALRGEQRRPDRQVAGDVVGHQPLQEVSNILA